MTSPRVLRRFFVAATLVVAALAPTHAPAQAGIGAPIAGALGIGDGINFVSKCDYSHHLPDDPIVRPSLPGASHDHSFFANRSTDAFSDYESLQNQPTSCGRVADTAAYWVPTLMQGQTMAKVAYVNVYYWPARKTPASIQSFPPGLRVVTDPALPVNKWFCAKPNSHTKDSETAPVCASDEHLVMTISFPDCWDGVNTDSVDHRSHMAYNVDGVCPSTHPVPLPGVMMMVQYPVARDGRTVMLTSGTTDTAHGDFFNSWDQPVLDNLVKNCINARVRCGETGNG